MSGLTILIACDGSMQTRAAVRSALQWLRPEIIGRVVLIAVRWPPQWSAAWKHALRKIGSTEGVDGAFGCNPTEWLSSVTNEVEDLNASIVTRIESGVPHEVITKAAREEGADLLIVSRGFAGAERLLADVSCPIFWGGSQSARADADARGRALRATIRRALRRCETPMIA